MPVTAKDLERVLDSFLRLTEAQERVQKAMTATTQAAKAEGDRIKAEKALLGR